MGGLDRGSLNWREIESFQYPEMEWSEDLSGEHFREIGEDCPGGSPQSRANQNANLEQAASISMAGPAVPPFGETSALVEEEFAVRMAAECNQAEERGHAKGVEIGLVIGREESSGQLASERLRLHSQAAALTASFSTERDRYMHRLEQETVHLALAIAAKILRREAQMDPLLLTGAVRVALGQLSQSTAVRLHVPVTDQPLWEEAMTRMPGLALRPVVVGEPRMELGECRMETELGSADLGLWPQLKEIERGFFDRMGGREANVKQSSLQQSLPPSPGLVDDEPRQQSSDQSWNIGEQAPMQMAASAKDLLDD